MANQFCIKYGLNEERLPKHVAIIMDGNGRWAKKQLRNRLFGHAEGADSVEKVTTLCREVGVKYLTLYAFSTENWNRPEDEVEGLVSMLAKNLVSRRKMLTENNIRLNVIGEISKYPKDVQKLMRETMALTSDNRVEMVLTLALSYGFRQEMTEAVRKIAGLVADGKLQPSEITEKTIAENLYTFDMPDPDLIIRTSGEYRLSNFLMWQASYSEFYFTDTLWPDFKKAEMIAALKDYAGRERRFGKTSEQLKST